MARSRLCRSCKQFHDLNEAWPSECLSHFGHTGTDAGFYVISDSMDPILSHASGNMHDSKSAYRRELRQYGCIELGNDRIKPTVKPRPPVAPDIKRAIEQLSSR